MISMRFSKMAKLFQGMIFLMALFIGSYAMAEGAADAAATKEVAVVAGEKAYIAESTKYIAIAVIMAVGSSAAAFAVGKIGAAAMGAAAEKPELLGRAIAFVGLGEGIALFGFLIALFLLN